MKMNYQTVFKTTLLVCAMGMMTACSNDENDSTSAEMYASFSNKLADGNKANLALTYSGDSLIGKNVIFQTTDSRTATITLQNVLPHETETTISNVALTADGNGGYAFSGTSASPLNTSFSYKGVVKDHKMSLDLSDVKIPANVLTEGGTWTMGNDGTYGTGHGIVLVKDLSFDMEFGPITIPAGSDFGQMAGAMLSNFIGTVLRDVTFSADGNITASYAPVPADLGEHVTDLLGGPLEREDSDWKHSSANLATAFMENDSVLYVTPGVDMILRQIKADKLAAQKQSRAGDYIDHGNFMQNVQDTYAALNQWTTTGLKIIVRPDDDGHIELVLKAEEIAALLKLVKTLPATVTDKEVEAGPLGKINIGDLLDKFEFSKDFYLSLYFTKAATK